MSLSSTADNNLKSAKPKRLLSLDALRGFDMFWIISGEGIFHSVANVVKEKHQLLRNAENWMIQPNGELSFLERSAVLVSNQLHHTVWNGFTFYDMIFPLFIFISGISMPFSYSKYFTETNPDLKRQARKTIYLALIKRTLILLLLGMVVNGLLQFKGYEQTRFASVLGRIALSAFFAALIFLNFNLKKQLIWFWGILLGYFALMTLIPVPGFGAGLLSPQGNLSAFIDQHFLPGKLHRIFYDPEGLLSTLPAVASALLGIFTGQFLRLPEQKFSSAKKSLLMTIAALVLLGIGLLWSIWFPINKNIWSSSFVLFAGGWSLLLFALFYAVIDVAGYRKWSMPFVWIGTNSILIYMAAHGLVNFESSSAFLFGGVIKLSTTPWQPVILWIGVLLIQLTVLKFLYDKKWFLKV
jgi:predicted acyltransferase